MRHALKPIFTPALKGSFNSFTRITFGANLVSNGTFAGGSTTGWVAGGSATVSASDADTPEGYEYAGIVTAGDATNERGIYELPALEAGETYLFSCMAKAGQGTTQSIFDWAGFEEDVDVPVTNADWQLYQFEVTATSVANYYIRFYANDASGSGNTGDQILFTGVMLQKVTRTTEKQ